MQPLAPQAGNQQVLKDLRPRLSGGLQALQAQLRGLGPFLPGYPTHQALVRESWGLRGLRGGGGRGLGLAAREAGKCISCIFISWGDGHCHQHEGRLPKLRKRCKCGWLDM